MKRVREGEFYWVPCVRTIGAFKVREAGDMMDDANHRCGRYFHTEEQALEVSRRLYYENRQKN